MGGVARLAGAAGVRESERRVLALVAAVFAAIEAGRALGEVGVNTLVLSRLPEDALPYLYIGLGAVSLVVGIAFGGALGRTRKSRLFGATLGGVGAVLVIERLALATGSAAVLPILWLTVTAAGTIAATIGWTVATSTFDARQAKRLFPLCTAAAIAGYFVGSLIAGPLAGLVGTESLVVVQAALFALAALMIARLARSTTGKGWSAPRGVPRPIVADILAGFTEVRRSPLMRLVAVAYVLFSVLAFSVTFPWLLAARAQFPAEADLALAIGLLSAAVTATSLVVSLVIANRVYSRLGVAGAALVLPLVYVVGFGVWIVQFSFATAAALVFFQQSVQRGLSNAAWSAFYNVVPAGRRAQVLAFQDGVPGQIGTALSGVLLLTAARFLAPDQVFWLGLATAVVLTAVVIAIRRRYVDSLLQTLRSGAGEQLLEGGPALSDLVAAADVRATLIEALHAPDHGTRVMAASLLARSTAPEARAALVGALGDVDPGVRGAAVGALLRGGDETARDRAEAVLGNLLAGGTDECVAGARALARLGRSLPTELAATYIRDPSPDVRASAMAILVGPDDATAPAALVAGLSDPSTVVRAAAADALSTRPRLPAAITDVLTRGSPDSQEAALRAMNGHRAEVAPVVQAWAEEKVTRAIALAECAHVLDEGRDGDGDSAHASTATDDDAMAYLRDVLGRRIERAQDLVLGAISVLGAPAARGVIRRCIRSGDADTRAQAIEALETIGDRRLGGALTRLVEHRPGGDHATRDEVLTRLGDDEDPWIRGLARRATRTGEQMPDSSPTLEHLETMLWLRRVPLFGRLEPEDLQRIAMAATERVFEANETILREGEIGDELFLLLEGDVHVTRREPDGSVRHFRDYAAGDHIGELAVLLDAPRAATVAAGSQGARALVIGGEGLRAILRERPDASMAMLATLAERISAQ